MAQMLGANPQELRQLGALMETKSAGLRDLASLLTSSLANAAWRGQDAQQFNSEWESSHRVRISAAVQLLVDSSKKLIHNAEEQERTSDQVGGGICEDRPQKSDKAPGGWTTYANWNAQGEARAYFKSGEWTAGVSPGDLHKTGKKPFEPKFGAEVSGSWKGHLGEAGVSYGDENLRFNAGVTGPYAEVNGRAGLSNKGFDASVSIKVGLSTTSVGVAYDDGLLKGSVRGDILAGGHVDASAAINDEGVKASGELFAGVKTKVEVSSGVGPIGAKVTGEVWAGMGVSGEMKFTMEGSKLKVKISGGFSFFAGGKVGLDLEVDFRPIVENVANFFKDFGSFLGFK